MDRSRLTTRLAGVVAIPVTPFGADGAVAEQTFVDLLDRLVTAGVEAVTPNGNTSEFYSLTGAEARRCAELAVRAVDGRASVLVGVGHDVATAVAAAEHAREVGAELVMVHQPVHPFVSAGGWVDYHRAVADAVPGLGVVPYVRDPAVTAAQLTALCDSCPNVVGIKYAVADPVRFAAVARDVGLDRLVWIAGLAEPYAPSAWVCGATGFTSGLVNVAPDTSLALLAALRAGDVPAAMAVWERVRPFEELRAADRSADNVSVVKEALAQLGLCRPGVRPPLRQLGEAGRAAVREVLLGWGLTPVGPEGTEDGR
ncbi:dihydrodipicolinate synthase family protein [Desertihabitans aurantiacus]|uniref:dihydrodipicolinate synthase family protein n=1 Tax=Desertihabitans aurantiacus TaxID=2282477 RepID=UPI000DF7A58E|nr:dihydrodipicolinate synthase family protein [Desertihabitans aurantiacus]